MTKRLLSPPGGGGNNVGVATEINPPHTVLFISKKHRRDDGPWEVILKIVEQAGRDGLTDAELWERLPAATWSGHNKFGSNVAHGIRFCRRLGYITYGEDRRYRIGPRQPTGARS